MKKLLLSTVAFASLTAGAMAADLPSRRPAPAPFVAVPVFTWTGFYAGVHAGYAFDASDNNNRGVFGNAGSFVATPGTLTAPLGGYTGTVAVTNFLGGRNNNMEGFAGGGHIGYNYQIGNIVVGIEADASYTDFGNNSQNRNNLSVVSLVPGVVGFSGAVNSGIASGGLDYYGTVRGRVGYALDRLLIFGTGGFAYGQGSEANNNFFLTQNGQVFSNGRRDNFRTGWVAGGGVEYAFTPNLTGRVEAQYVSLERETQQTFIGAVGTTPVFVANNRRADNDFVVVRAGVSYKFNLF